MKIYFALLLITLVFGHGLQVVEEKIEEEDRRELLAITGAAILAACISGVVGGITGAVATRGIDACAGRRDKTVVIIRDEKSGEYRQKDTRRLLMGAKAAGEVNGNGVSFEGSHTCPEDPENVVVALQRNVKDDGTAYFTIPTQFFDPVAYSKVDAKQQEYFKKITPKEKWQLAIKKVIMQNREKKAMGVQAIQGGTKKTAEYVQIASQNVKSAGTMQYLPHVSLAVALTLLGVFAYRKNNEQKTFVHEELLDPTL